MAIFLFFKTAAYRHLGVLKFRNFNCRYGSEGRERVTMANFMPIGQAVAKIWRALGLKFLLTLPKSEF